MKIIFDLSSLLWTCLSVGKDGEGSSHMDPDGKPYWVNTAGYGYEFAVNSIKATLDRYNCTPIDAIFAVEGMNSKSKRLMINARYKSGRGKRPVQAYEEFSKLRATMIETFRKLGSIFVTHDNVEGDDTVGWLATNMHEECVVRSNDNDLGVLSGVNKNGVMVHTWIGDRIDENKYGLFPMKYISLYKAMVGDNNDSITGIVGFGDGAWRKFHAEFGEDGMAEMVRLAELGSLAELELEARENKIIKQLWDGRNDFLNSYKLAKLHPEWCDTMQDIPVWEPGMVAGEVKDERLRQWCGRTHMITADRFDNFLPWLRDQLKLRPWLALDIETSSADESDDWLAAQGDPEGVDVIGSSLTGMSLTFGRNMEHTVYLPMDHVETNNINKDQMFAVLQAIDESGVEVAIQHTPFEGTILYMEFGERWKDNGFGGFIPRWLDTKLEASYVNENDSLGLKKLSRQWLKYEQVEYKTAVTIDGVMYKMNQLPAEHVFDYATDDTICTAALHNFFKLHMELENCYDIYKETELNASYLHTAAYVAGTRVDMAKRQVLMAEESADAQAAQQIVDAYLISKGWEGTILPVYTEVTVPAMKFAYQLATGEELKTLVRTPSKVLPMLESCPLAHAACQSVESLNAFIASRWTAAPVFNAGSPKQMQRLLYETMNLPPRVFNKPTDAMKAAGEKLGSVKTDALAITYALLDAKEEDKAVLEALKVISLVGTRFKLFYNPLPGFVHWKTGRVHSSHNQCGTNTRRASSSKPNLQQLSKHEKVEGYYPRVRELYLPHKKNAVTVSFDFKSQELLLMAEWSRDANLIACFVGETKIDMHSMTGVGIYNNMNGKAATYLEFLDILADDQHPDYKKAKKARALGKAVNFGGQYRIAAPKLSTMLLVTEDEAQAMLDAKALAFPGVEQWSQDEMEACKRTGKVLTMNGAPRHLRSALLSEDRYLASKAPRQALSFRIQGSAAEMTKLAEGRMWLERILDRFDCEYFAAVHDECVWSVATDELYDFIQTMYPIMTANYAGMTLPIVSSVSIGPNFGEQYELEGDFSLENIQKILSKFQLQKEIA